MCRGRTNRISEAALRSRYNPPAEWPESSWRENNTQIFVGTENYDVSGDGLLMPSKKGQAPPDLRYFDASRKR